MKFFKAMDAASTLLPSSTLANILHTEFRTNIYMKL